MARKFLQGGWKVIGYVNDYYRDDDGRQSVRDVDGWPAPPPRPSRECLGSQCHTCGIGLSLGHTCKKCLNRLRDRAECELELAG